jgi:hypothetical protein
MFMRFTKATRLRAGYFLALVYLLCVLAPAASFAFPGGSKLAPCLTDSGHEFGIVHMHDDGAGVSRHVHRGGDVHEHPDGQAHFVKSVNVDGAAVVADDVPVSADDHPKAAGAQCCGLTCVSALPATVIEIVKPAAPMSVRDAENYRRIADNAPPRHYRPPIS